MEPTYKSLARAKEAMTLVVHPGTDTQRALRTVLSSRLDHQDLAVRQARVKHPDAPLAWLLPDGSFVGVL
jgi:hypothetical protein